MGFICLLTCSIWLIGSISGQEMFQKANYVESTPVIHLRVSEAFYFSINEKVYNFSDFVTDSSVKVKYRPSLLSMPDLPSWIKFIHSDDNHDGYLYGIPSRMGSSVVEVVATNLETYMISRKLIRLQVNPRSTMARYEVQMKFSNYNVDEIFVEDRLERLMEIFAKRLWKTQVYITLVDSAVQLGGRRPPNPKEKDGVIVRIGSTIDFTMELKNLNREVLTIRNREPCAKDFKNTLAERFFREENFISDWCGFKLIYDNQLTDNAQVLSYSPILLQSDEFQPPDRVIPINPQRLVDFLMCLILPTVLALILAAVLSWIMFGRREGVEKRNKQTPNIQMVQYASIHRASANLRGMNNTRANNGPTPLVTTPNSTLQRSPANSNPNNTLTKGI
ncbi:hypothetical protein CHUAL_000921 [Chamberlinius hualienensis]